jgi:hypothetical protein
MNNGLLICPECETRNQKRILGSVDEAGGLHIKRGLYEGGTTVIQSNNMTIICSCGFGTTIGKHYLYDATPAQP